MQLKPVVGVLFNLLQKMSKTTFTLKRKLFNVAGSTFGRIMGFNNWSNVGHMMTGNLNTATNLATKQTVKINPATNKAVNGNMAWNITKGIAKPLAVAGGLAVGTGALAKKGIEKAGEQSDGSKLFSQTKKDNMATTYRLKRKIFADFKNMSTEKLEKIAAQEAGAGNTIVAGAKQELSSRTPALATPKPTPKPNVPTPKPTPTTKPGMMSVLRTKWNGLGTMGKIGVGAGVLGAAGLMAKGLMGNKKDKQ